jgi:hypothetical protein
VTVSLVAQVTVGHLHQRRQLAEEVALVNQHSLDQLVELEPVRIVVVESIVIRSHVVAEIVRVGLELTREDRAILGSVVGLPRFRGHPSSLSFRHDERGVHEFDQGLQAT